MGHGDLEKTEKNILLKLFDGVDLVHWDADFDTNIAAKMALFDIIIEEAGPRIVAVHNTNLPNHASGFIASRLENRQNWRKMAEGVHQADPRRHPDFLENSDHFLKYSDGDMPGVRTWAIFFRE